MAHLLSLKTFSSDKGSLTVIEKNIPFEIKRVFFIYGLDESERGNHRHHKTIQAIICVKGRCVILINDGITKQEFIMDSPEKCLLVEPKDFHKLHQFTADAIVLVLASEYFDVKDYIFE